MLDEHTSAIHGLLRRVAVVDVDDSGSQQRLRLSGLASEQFRNVVRLHDFGFASHPPAGAEGLLLAQGGRSDRAWAVGFEHQAYRQKNLPVGTLALYDQSGNVMKLLAADGVSFDFQQNAWIAQAGGVKVIARTDHICVDPGSKTVYLGGQPGAGTFAAVATVAGPSINVQARIG